MGQQQRMKVSQMSEERNLKSNSRLVVKEGGDYHTVRSNGPMTAKVAFTAQNLRANGPFSAADSVSAGEANFNGPAKIKGSASFGKVKFNGPAKIQGDLTIAEAVKVNGPLVLTGGLTATPEVDFKINGPYKGMFLTEAGYVKVNGPVNCGTVTNLRGLTVNGPVVADTVEVAEKLTIELGTGDTEIGMVKATDVEVGFNLSGNENRGILGSFFRLVKSEPGFGVIDEIHATGVVELDNVKVGKVVARELYAGENTEIGEFVELVDEKQEEGGEQAQLPPGDQEP